MNKPATLWVHNRTKYRLLRIKKDLGLKDIEAVIMFLLALRERKKETKK